MKGPNGADLWSGKHRHHDGNIQVLSDPTGFLIWSLTCAQGVNTTPPIAAHRALILGADLVQAHACQAQGQLPVRYAKYLPPHALGEAPWADRLAEWSSSRSSGIHGSLRCRQQVVAPPRSTAQTITT